MKKRFYLRFFQAGLVLIFLFPAIIAAETGKSYYHRSADRLFWLMVISDIHIGDSGSQDTQYLTRAVNDAYNTIHPEFIVATGDLTDATNGGIIPDKQFSEEWEVYRQIVVDAGMHAGIYYDIPGNHDHYRDGDVDGLDFSAMLTEAGREDCTLENSCDWDFDNSGDVGTSDIYTVAGEYGSLNCP